MTLKTKIASAILFIVVATAHEWRGFYLEPVFINYWMIITVSLGILLLIVAKINIWLKLFLCGAITNTVYANNPSQATLCLGGIIFFMGIYYFLTKFKPDEIKNLLAVVVIVVLIQAIWVSLEVLHVYQKFGALYKRPEMCGTIGYVNLVALLLASTLPLMFIYKRKFIPVALFALWFCNSYTSLGALAVSIGIFLFEKSKKYLVIALILIGMTIYFGFPKFQHDIRPHVWKGTIREIKKVPYFGEGFGSFKQAPLFRIKKLREGLIILAKQGDEDAQYVLEKVEKEEYPSEYRMVNIYTILKENTIPRANALRDKLDPLLGSVAALRAHNTLLNLTREGGLVSSIPIVGFMIVTIINFIRCKKTQLQKAIFGALGGFYVGMMFDFPDNCIATAVIMTVIVAANTVLVKSIKKEA